MFPLSDEAQEAEAIQVVNAILDLREQQSVQTPAVMCKIYFTTAMLQFILGDMPKVSPYSFTTCFVISKGKRIFSERKYAVVQYWYKTCA